MELRIFLTQKNIRSKSKHDEPVIIITDVVAVIVTVNDAVTT